MTWKAQGKYVFDGADCIGIFDTDNDTDKNMEDKACMAAAAPDLLEALERALAEFDSNTDWRDQAREAIAKAKGQAQ